MCLLGSCWVGGKEAKFSGKITKKNKSTYFDTVHAIQILSERVQKHRHIYLSYEMNLVLKDGSRINVLDHNNKTQVLSDANLLPGLLNTPIWDVST